MRRNWQWFVGVVAFLSVAACLAGINPDYNPNWEVGDQWTIRTTYLRCGMQKDLNPSHYPTNMVFPYTFLYDYTYDMGEYSCRVETNTNSTVVIVMTPTNVLSVEKTWILEFETDELTLQKITKEYRRPAGFEETSKNVYGLDTWATEEMGAPATVLDFPQIPVDSVSTNRLLNIPSVPGGVVEQDTVFTSSNVTIVLTRTNVLDGLDHKVTLVWPKGAKWWKSVKEEMGTNLVLSAERLDP